VSDGLRRFLLDYAEKAPKAGRNEMFDADDPIRFDNDGDFVCPLELAGDLFPGEWRAAAYRYDVDPDLIVTAADGGDDDPAVRAWRAILEKLAEPEVRA